MPSVRKVLSSIADRVREEIAYRRVARYIARSVAESHVATEALLLANHYELQRAEAKALWRNVTTDPKRHVDDKFCYCVIGIRGISGRKSLSVIRGKEGQFGEPGWEHRRILEESYNSTSLIDQDHRTTIAPIGFIIDFDPENILGTYATDALSPMGEGRRSAFAEEFFSRRPLYPPTEILANTRPDRHNEILIYSQKPFPIKVVGIFIKLNPDYESYLKDHPNVLATWNRYAQEHGLPVVLLRDPEARYFE